MIGLGLGLARYRSGSSATQFSPASLFSSGEVGVWYDPSDLSTMFTDTAGTTQASVGQAVARINDKSGNGLNATQATASKRPILRQSGALYYLEFDGVDDTLVTPTITPGTDKAQLFLGLSHDIAAVSVIIESSTGSTTNGTVRIIANSNGSYKCTSIGTAATSPTTPAHTIPDKCVLTMLSDISAPVVNVRRNGLLEASSTSSQGTGSYAAYPIYIGSRAGTSFPFTGKMFGAIARFGANLDADAISETETWMNAKTGAY